MCLQPPRSPQSNVGPPGQGQLESDCERCQSAVSVVWKTNSGRLAHGTYWPSLSIIGIPMPPQGVCPSMYNYPRSPPVIPARNSGQYVRLLTLVLVISRPSSTRTMAFSLCAYPRWRLALPKRTFFHFWAFSGPTSSSVVAVAVILSRQDLGKSIPLNSRRYAYMT